MPLAIPCGYGDEAPACRPEEETTQGPILFSETDIAAAVASNALQLGRTYWRQGHVHKVDRVAFDRLEGRVEGSGRTMYGQSIRLVPNRGGRVSIVGTCTCPVGRNCKHVAAVLFEALPRGVRGTPGAHGVPAPAASAAVLSPGIVDWLQRLDKAGMVAGEAYPPDVAHRLVYVLSESRGAGRAPGLVLTLVTAGS